VANVAHYFDLIFALWHGNLESISFLIMI